MAHAMIDHVPRTDFRHLKSRRPVSPLVWIRPRARNAYRREQTNGHRDDWQGFVNGELRALVRRPPPIERYRTADWAWHVRPGPSAPFWYEGRAGSMRLAKNKATDLWARSRAVRAQAHRDFTGRRLGGPFPKNVP